LAHIDEDPLELMLRGVLDASKITKNLFAELFSEDEIMSSTLSGNAKNKDNLPNVLAVDKVTLIENYVMAHFPLTKLSKVGKRIGEKREDESYTLFESLEMKTSIFDLRRKVLLAMAGCH
jgi:hypothetical protein